MRRYMMKVSALFLPLSLFLHIDAAVNERNMLSLVLYEEQSSTHKTLEALIADGSIVRASNSCLIGTSKSGHSKNLLKPITQVDLSKSLILSGTTYWINDFLAVGLVGIYKLFSLYPLPYSKAY